MKRKTLDNPLKPEDGARSLFSKPTEKETVQVREDERVEERVETKQPNKHPKSRAKTEKLWGKPPSFEDTIVEKVTADIPKDLVQALKILAVKRSTRLNQELAAAVKMYLAEQESIKYK